MEQRSEFYNLQKRHEDLKRLCEHRKWEEECVKIKKEFHKLQAQYSEYQLHASQITKEKLTKRITEEHPDVFRLRQQIDELKGIKEVLEQKNDLIEKKTLEYSNEEEVKTIINGQECLVKRLKVSGTGDFNVGHASDADFARARNSQRGRS